MPGSFAAYFLFGYLNPTTVANNPFVANAFVFAACTLPVFNGSKNAFAKKTISLGFKGPIVNGFRFGNFTAALLQDVIWRS